jgi:malate dehydrogenase (oxaloacetate-decarboxylating)
MKADFQTNFTRGAGSPGVNITIQIRDAIVTVDGISREQAKSKFWAVDKKGVSYESDVGTKNMDKY